MLEEKDNRCIAEIYNINKKLKSLLFNYLNFLSSKTKDYKENYLSYKYNTSFKENTNNNQDKDNIAKRNEYFLNKIESEFPLMNKVFESFNIYIESHNKKYPVTNGNVQELAMINNIIKLRYVKNSQNNDIIGKNNIIYLIFKNMVNIMEDSIVRETLRSERRNIYLSKNKIIKSPKKKNELEKSFICESIKDYIKTYFNESKIEITCNIVNIASKNYNKFRVLSSSYPSKSHQYNNPLNTYNQIAQINLKLFPFSISMSLYLNKNKEKLNISIKDEYQRKSFSNLILFKKINILFQSRINSIFNIINSEKRRNYTANMNNNNILFDEEDLIDLLKRFINYIYDYNNITKKKCGLCEKIIKYSYSEKAFLPPYYKLYKEKDINQMNAKNINELDQKLFFHEECFKKTANYSL
jgi:hypothetical protein